MPLPEKSTASMQDVPKLRSLGPAYDEDLHGRHARALIKVLVDQSVNAPRNIALAGHYGSGKSSVILGVQAGLDEKKISWVNLSLSSLGVDSTKRARVQEDGSVAPLTNLIQKEIVKQLLYRKAPKDMPGSRYFRIDSFNVASALQWSVAASISFIAIAVLLGLVSRVKEVAPTSFADGPEWGPWLAVGILGAFVGVLCFLVLRGLQNRLKVESVSAGGAAVSLSAKENSYFDEYLDEIVYFFQQTKTQIAIFEDLDRFKDPHIFETLRELNTVLNHSEQVRSRPVKFVYAVRDSIFEQLDAGAAHEERRRMAETEAADNEQPASALGDLATSPAATPRASSLESAPSANRTKFFDLVVPMIPFLTHRSARDLLADEFKNSPRKPSSTVINLVGGDRALTDMRLIRNIRNEFEIYSASVLSEQGLQGLTADRLFAMMVYKNTHLEDFEAIRLGTSRIDAAHRVFRQMVEHQVKHQASRSRAALRDVRKAVPWDERAKAVGETLQRVLPLLHRANRNRGVPEPEVNTSAGTFPMSELTSGRFWAELHDSDDPIDIGVRGYQLTRLSLAELLMLAGDRGMAIKSDVELDLAELQRMSSEALVIKEFVAKASMSELMGRTDLTMPVGENGQERNLDELVSQLVSPLAHDLLAQGLLDENFTLYCSDYQGVAISVSAMNFILHCVQVDRADPLFRFDCPESIDAVEAEVGQRFLEGESVFNIEVFNHYLAKDPVKLNSAFDRLIVRASAGDTSFVNLYLEDETRAVPEAKHQLLRELASRWTGVFVHLAGDQAFDRRVEFVDTAIRAASEEINYQASDQFVELVKERYLQMTVFTDPLPEEKAVALSKFAQSLGIQIDDLTAIGENQRRAFVAASLYPVTRMNLVAALSTTEVGPAVEDEVFDDQISLALDSMMKRSSRVYEHVVENLTAYLQAVHADEVTVEEPEAFVGVINDIANGSETIIQTVAERASTSCAVDDLTDLDENAWTPVVSVQRMSTTASNVSQYVRRFGVTSMIAENLTKGGLVYVDAVDDDTKSELAHALVQAETLSVPDRVSLVGSLELPEPMDPSALGAGLTLLPELVAAGHVPDDAETYACVADQPYSLRSRYFESSRELVAYVTELDISADDLAELMKNGRIANAVKTRIASEVDFVSGRMSRRTAIAICEWAMKGNEVSAALVLALSRAQAPADKILVLLEPHLSDIALDTLDAILVALDDEYERLTHTGRHRPRLKARDGTDALLETLKRHNRVSSYGKAGILTSDIRVNMRQ